jgi:hypothetical protein
MNYYKTICIDKFEDIKLNYNSINFNFQIENIKPYLEKIAEKYNYHKNMIKLDCVNNLTKLISKEFNFNNINIISDYKENSNKNITLFNICVNIIFNINNYERLCSNDNLSCVLIDLYNFNNNINLISKYFPKRIFIYIHPYYILFGKFWFIFNVTTTSKHLFIDYSIYNPQLYIILNKLSTYLKYLYSHINEIILDNEINKINKFKKIINDEQIKNVLNVLGFEEK